MFYSMVISLVLFCIFKTSSGAILLCSSSQNTCKNNATCLSVDGVVKCNCLTGYTGSACEISLMVTTSTKSSASIALCPNTNTQCKNGATCYLLSGTTVICKCAPNYTGATCETLLVTTTTQTPCPDGPNQCLNGGFCYLYLGTTPSCTCPAGFTGTRCETSLSTTTASQVALCSNVNTQCKNGATCYLLSGTTVICKCAPNFTGATCETSLVPITTSSTTLTTASTTPAPLALCPSSSEICKNSGMCFILNGATIKCQCKSGFTGAFCETKLTTTLPPTTSAPAIALCPATPTVCKNGGTCLILNGSTIKCQCTASYTGAYCDVPVITTLATTLLTTTKQATITQSACSTLKCKYGGQRIFEANGSCRCKCPENFYGIDCAQFNITVLPSLNDPIECNSIPCDNVPESEITGLCPLKCLICSSSLNGESCQNAGILRSNCKCECLSGYTGDYCESKPGTCPADGPFCGTQFPSSQCLDEFIKSVCPNMCGAC